ncbi:MAG: phage portal protein [Roseburia sp.]|nr:phage portal protein [Roseburia sp.]
MYKFSIEQVKDPVILTKLVKKFKAKERRRFNKAQRYYEVKNDIYARKMSDLKENNKIAHGFARYITNMATAYFIGKPVRYSVDDEAYQKALDDVLNKNYINMLNFEVSKEASKKGIGFLLIYINEEGKLKIKKCDAEEIIPVFSTSLGEYLECAVRLSEEYDIDGKFLKEGADIYDKERIYHYERTNRAADFEFVSDEPHLLSDVPAIVIKNNEEMIGDYEPQYSIIDGYDKGQSNTGNDVDYFADSYLALVGAGGGLESIGSEEPDEDGNRAAKNLKEHKLLFLDEGGQAFFIEKNPNDTATENYKNRLFKDLFFLSQVPALTDENFSGNLTGVAIRYKLTGLEELAIMKENNFQAAQHKMIKLITDYLNTIQNKEYDPEQVTQKYTRNFIDNESEIISNVTQLENVVSKETQLNMLPQTIVDNAQEELNRMEAERIREEKLPLAPTEV